ncbi:MAG: hypothetical protein MNPFHGCM_03054 [Gemmatimonadaceae bacterium]|nr:hypothetical protein [Gemmatimonadaceae bacterium]
MQSRVNQSFDSALAEFQQTVSSGVGKQSVLEQTVRILAGAFDVPLCKILELTEDRSALLVTAGVGWEDGVVGVARVSAKPDSQPGYTLMGRDAVIFEDLSDTHRFTAASLARSHGIISSVCVPIGDGVSARGVICIHDTKKRKFSREELRFLRDVARGLRPVLSLRTDV